MPYPPWVDDSPYSMYHDNPYEHEPDDLFDPVNDWPDIPPSDDPEIEKSLIDQAAQLKKLATRFINDNFNPTCPHNIQSKERS